MTDPELFQILDYILNRSDAVSLDVLSEAVTRRRRDLSLFNALSAATDPQKMVKEISRKINEGLGAGIDGMRKSIQEMIITVLREHAPELSENQIDELCRAWLPDAVNAKKSLLPSDVLLSMIEQFISFSHGEMNESVDKNLRETMGNWPQRYWKAFPPLVRQIITDYLKDKITEREYKSKIVIALGL